MPVTRRHLFIPQRTVGSAALKHETLVVDS